MKIALLSGGVGGAKLARGLEAIADLDVTVIVNVGDDETVYGLDVSPDLDTVVYTMAGVQGPHGWGRIDDTTEVMHELGKFGVDTSFMIGDRDLALNVYRTARLKDGAPLSSVTAEIARRFSLRSSVVPATDDRLRTEVRTDRGWLDFQTYFVRRHHTDRVSEVRFAGSDSARPAPGVLEAIAGSDLVVIGPSNPVLSIWPILAVSPIRSAVAEHTKVVAVSPLIGGNAVKGPAADIMDSLGLGTDLAGLLGAYGGLLTGVVIDHTDGGTERDAPLPILVTATMMRTIHESRRLAEEILAWR